MSGDRFSGLTQGESNLERYPKLKNAAWVIMFALIIITIGYDLLFPSKSIDVSRDQLPITLRQERQRRRMGSEGGVYCNGS
jgi:hypothetical protein